MSPTPDLTANPLINPTLNPDATAPTGTAPNAPASQATNEDREHLRMLALAHKVVAAFAALFALFPVIHLAMGIAMIGGGLFAAVEEGPEGLLVSLFGLFFTLIPLAFILMGLALAYFLYKAAGDLTAYRNHTRCLVVAAVSCCFAPFGTVLGVFTLIVLLRPQVKELFAQSGAESL